MEDMLYLRTDIFEHKNVKDHFPCPISFGEDFATWLKDQTQSITEKGFEFGETCLEDFGCCFDILGNEENYFVALSFAEECPVDEPACWVVTLQFKSGLGFLKKLFNKPQSKYFNEFRDLIWSVIKNNPDIETFSEEEWAKLA